MGLAYYVTLERPIPGVEPAQKPRARVAARNDKRLSEIAQALGVLELLEFSSQDPSELRSFLSSQGADVSEFDLPEENWFEADAGLKTVRALQAHVRAEPASVDDAVGLSRELEAFEEVLTAALQHEIRWHLTIDY